MILGTVYHYRPDTTEGIRQATHRYSGRNWKFQPLERRGVSKEETRLEENFEEYETIGKLLTIKLPIGSLVGLTTEVSER